MGQPHFYHPTHRKREPLHGDVFQSHGWEVALAIGVFLPWLELTCAGCLLLGKAIREASLILVVLLVGLLAYRLGFVDRYVAGQIKNTLATYGVRHIVYGSDTPVIDSRPTLRSVQSLGEAVEEALLRDNPARLLNLV